MKIISSKGSAKVLLIAIVSQLFFSISVQAATAPAYVAPLNSHLYIELNTGKDHPFKGQIESILQSNLGSSQNENSALVNLLSENLDNTIVGFSQSFHQTDGSEIYVLTIQLAPEIFDQIVSGIPGDQLTKTDLGQGRTIYLTSDDFYFTYKNGNLLASNKEGMISDLLMQESSTYIGQNPDFQFLQSKSNPDSFFKTFINYDQLPKDTTDTTNTDLSSPNLLKSQGISLAQTTNGIDGLMTVKMDQSADLNPSAWTFTPELFKKINAQNILLYTESFDLADHTDESLKILNNSSETIDISTIYQEIANSISESTGLDLSTDLAPLLKHRTAFALHSDYANQLYPTLTIISEVPNEEFRASATLDILRSKLLESLKQEFEAAYDSEVAYRNELINFYGEDSSYQPKPLPAKETLEKDLFSSSTVSENGLSFNQISFDPNYRNYFYEENYVSDPKTHITLSTAVANGLMYVTTMKNPGQALSNNGLANDTQWQSNYNGESLLDVSFLNLINVKNYISDLATNFGSTSEDMQSINDFFAPLKSFYSQNRYENNTYLVNFRLGLDFSKLDKFIELFKTLNYFNNYPDTTNVDWQNYLPEINFLDVPEDSWFAPYVSHVANIGIMRGYSGSLFKPAQNITRAEFIKTVMAAYENAGYYTTEVEPENYFNDVEIGTWYAPFVNKAKMLGVVKGYNDNTFRPAEAITRAEAATILTNLFALNNSYGNLKELPFYDVKPTDWYFPAIQKAFTQQFMTGKSASTFAPQDLLTRAETSAIISRYLDRPYSY